MIDPVSSDEDFFLDHLNKSFDNKKCYFGNHQDDEIVKVGGRNNKNNSRVLEEAPN